MRVIINLVLFLVICVLVWTLTSSIQEPIAFNAEKTKRDNAVINRLKAIRSAQELFREASNGEGYAPDFDSLEYVLRNGKIMTISVLGNPDDPNDPTITYDTSYTPVMDRIAEFNSKSKDYKISLDSLRYVPYGNGETFEITADTITYQQTLVNVLEVKTRKENYMGEKYSDARFSRYDATYDPKSYIKFGDLNAPNLTGNWE